MTKLSMREAIRGALREELIHDKTVFLIGEDLGTYGGCFDVTQGLLKEFGSDRVIDTPISEGGFTGMAVGAAMAGYRPVVELMFCDFSTCAMDAIANQAAKQRFMMGGQVNVPMVIRMPFGCGTGAAAQHSQSLEAWFCHVPGLYVAAPSGAYDAKGLLKTAIRTNTPVIFLEHKLCYPLTEEVPETEYTIPFGKAVIRRPGTDITIISYSHMLHKSLCAAQRLEQTGISAEIVDLRSLFPLDTQTILQSAEKTGRVLIVHESVQKFGIGAEIASVIAGSDAFYSLKCPIKRLGGADMPIPFSPSLEAACVPQPDNIYESAKQMVTQ